MHVPCENPSCPVQTVKGVPTSSHFHQTALLLYDSCRYALVHTLMRKDTQSVATLGRPIFVVKGSVTVLFLIRCSSDQTAVLSYHPCCTTYATLFTGVLYVLIGY
jgi:hypothetical protein